jgi:hypothetical protein
MKTKKIILLSTIVFTICSAFTVASTVFTQSGLNEKDIQKQLVNIALYGREPNTSTVFDFYKIETSNISLLRTFIKNGLDKKETADALFKYTKDYYNSDAFKQAYNTELAKQKPNPFYSDTVKLWKQYEADLQKLEAAYVSGKKANTKDAVEKSAMANNSSSDQGIDAAMKMLANNPELAAQSGMTPEQIKQMLEQAKAANQQAKTATQEAVQNEFGGEAGKKRQTELDQQYQHEKELLLKSYQKQAKDLTTYLLHADSKANIKAALSKSISIIDSVDFGATLNGRRFAKPEYEAKDNRWKMVYRAGKDNAAIAKAAAAQWLSELK